MSSIWNISTTNRWLFFCDQTSIFAKGIHLEKHHFSGILLVLRECVSLKSIGGFMGPRGPQPSQGKARKWRLQSRPLKPCYWTGGMFPTFPTLTLILKDSWSNLDVLWYIFQKNICENRRWVVFARFLDRIEFFFSGTCAVVLKIRTRFNRCIQKKREPISTLQQFPCHSRSLTARPWEMVGLEDDPFLLGFCKFSGVFALKLRCWVFSVRTFWWRPATIFAVGLPNQSRLNLARNLAFKGIRINISIVYSIIWTQKMMSPNYAKKLIMSICQYSIYCMSSYFFMSILTSLSWPTWFYLFQDPVETGRG